MSIKGLLICPSKQTITEVEVEENEDSYLSSMYRLIDCDAVDVVRNYLHPFGCEDDLWVDDEALLKEAPVMWGFTLYPKDVAFPIIGNALVLGVDLAEGECTSHTLTPEAITAIRKKLQWCYLAHK